MHQSRITLRTIIRGLLLLVVMTGFLLYVVWQSRVFITGPVVTIHDAPPATTSATLIPITGTAENIVWITINDRPIVTTPEGDFKESIVLEKGYTSIKVQAADRFGRLATHIFPVVPVPATTTDNQ